jgi:hypothetical protein
VESGQPLAINLEGNMDSGLEIGSTIQFRCDNTYQDNQQIELPAGYKYRFKVKAPAPCPNDPDGDCVFEGDIIDPDPNSGNSAAMSKVYEIQADGEHQAQCAVCRADDNDNYPDTNCDWMEAW